MNTYIEEIKPITMNTISIRSAEYHIGFLAPICTFDIGNQFINSFN